MIRRSLIFAAIITLFISCGPSNSVSVTNFSPTGEVNNLTTFTIEFSENLAPADKQNLWLTDEFIEFEPKIPGQFKWLDARTLIFSPDVPLEPIQKYTANVTNKVLFNSTFSPDFDEYEFHTPDFDVKSVDFFWTRIPNQTYKLSVQANINFNYGVNPDQLKQYLTVLKEGEEVKDFEIVSQNSSEVIAVNFGEVQQTDDEQEFEIVINKGLESIIGKKPLQDTRKFSKDLPPITKLQITGVSSEFDGSTASIIVGTTQMVDETKLKDYVRLKPERDLQFFATENSFRIETDLENMETVELKIAKGLPGLYGGELEFEYEQVVSLVSLNPSIDFADKSGKYLMLGGNKNLQANVVNVDEVEIEVSQIFKNNLIHFLDRYSYTYNNYDGYYNPSFYTESFGRELYTEKVELSGNRNWLQKVDVNLDKALENKYKGIYTVTVRSAEDRWIQDSKMVAISDLAIIAKKSKDQIIVFVNSIKNAEPVPDVTVSVISYNNQTRLEGITGESGIVTFNNVAEQLKDFRPQLITAERDDDFNYIDLRETYVETSRFDVGGKTEYSETYQAFIYGDRNLYRPGDKVNLSAIVHDNQINVVKDLPVIVKVISPTGKTFDEFKKDLNDEGSFELSFNMPDYALTGQYRADLYIGSNQLIGVYSFSVEDFVPDKIRVALKKDKEKYFPGDKVEINADAEFLFGAKASGLKYEADIQLRHQPFVSETFGDYDFSRSTAENTSVENTFVDGNLNEEGQADISYIIPNSLTGGGIIKGYAFFSVFDLTGRPVNRSTDFTIYPKNYFLGIKAPGYYFGTNEKLNFKAAVVDYNDKAINSFTATAQLVRYEWQTILKKDYSGRYYYASEEKEVLEWEKDINFGSGLADIQFVLSRSGKYQLKLAKKGRENEGFVYKQFYAYGWGSSTASSFEVDKEGRVEIVFDKKEYEPGENAKILFMTPFAGKMLITFERNGVYEHQYVDVKERSYELNIETKDSFMPNTYVTATLFRPHEADNKAPFLVAHGFASMKVEKKANKLPVTITANEKIKPNTKQTVTIKTSPSKDIYVTLAAVDEGILQIKNYQTPDPYGYMYAKRPLRVDSYDLYKLLLPEIVSTSSSTGGDKLAAELQKRANPITTKRFKLLAFWSGIRKTNSDGVVKIDLDIPQFNGEVRLMALAYTGSKFGSADKAIKVADDLIIEPEIPRVLSVGDSLVMPVTVINTTDKEGDVEINVSVEGPLKLNSPSSSGVSVKPNSTAKGIFVITTDKKVGKAKIKIETNGLAKVTNEIEIGIRPISPYVTETGSGTINAGKEVKVNIPTNFLEGTQSTVLTISKFPGLKFAKQLKYLVGFPYGCLEQTVSKLFPQIYFDELAKVIAPEIYRTNNPVYFVKEGIRKIESMQRYDGAFTYWQGGDYINEWSTVYAVHFLLEAKKAGYQVNQQVLNKALNYLQTFAKEKKVVDYTTYEGSRRTVTKIADKATIYSLYVLALGGKADLSSMNYYKARPHLLSEDTKYLLAGAYALNGKWTSYKQLLPEIFTPEVTERQTGYWFDSEVRANAIMLNVLLEVDPTNEQVQSMVRHLASLTERMYSTQDKSWAFLALGKAASLNADADVTVDVLVGDKKISTYTGNDLSLNTAELNGAEITLKASGKGEVYYFWSTEGVKVNKKVEEKDSYMAVRRYYYDYRNGGQVNNFTQGQMILAKITLTGYERSAENIVITDMIPAGFEIENPRLTEVNRLNINSANLMNIQFSDFRDDRLILFTNLQRNKTSEFYYLLRVVNKGKFELPAIGAEALYDKEYSSYNGAKQVAVR